MDGPGSSISPTFESSGSTARLGITKDIPITSSASPDLSPPTSVRDLNDNRHLNPVQNSSQCHTVILFGAPIAALIMDGKERLCLAQISNILLKDFSYNEIHNRRVALGITCVQCTPVQLEMLRRVGAMPASSRRCGMITHREAERLCKSFLVENKPPKLPENFSFDVFHLCAWGCRGSFIPSRYNSSRAKCVKCRYCGLFFSPNKFIFHSHRMPDSKYQQPDAANFNSWRRHINLIEESPSETMQQAWEDVKAMFNGGNRRRSHQRVEKHIRPLGPALNTLLHPYADLEKMRPSFPAVPSYQMLYDQGVRPLKMLTDSHREIHDVEPLSPSSSLGAIQSYHQLSRSAALSFPETSRSHMPLAQLHDPRTLSFSAEALRNLVPPHLTHDAPWKHVPHGSTLPPQFLSAWHAFMFPRSHLMGLHRHVSQKSDFQMKEESESMRARGSPRVATAPPSYPFGEDQVLPGVWNFTPQRDDATTPPSASFGSPKLSAFRPLPSPPRRKKIIPNVLKTVDGTCKCSPGPTDSPEGSPIECEPESAPVNDVKDENSEGKISHRSTEEDKIDIE